ncbi:LysR family transcriptional regulator [Hansschlegelia zhihuaiae]|uniref:LysR family transcriptional regulator n=1 Tax=Hansschlegelia zhihuaiae TaxID=405005 RepID=A0A4Q0MHC2_9HYPH|nr:LysR family transcriptional regulator [Hansschlegelia zhihuaiae]RXF72967.1 LysR family transcriptional regulator [Hansschlegelia zhihuaiae]
MELVWLEDFLALAEALNFSRAAEARHVTQPAFSRRVRAFETWIGAELFERGPRGVALTRAGQHVLAHAGEITRRIYDLRREVRAVSGREAHAVRFCCTHALSFTFFPGWVRAQAPGLGSIRLISDNMAACEQVMRRGDAEFLLCHHDPELAELFEANRFPSVVVGLDRIVPVCAPDASGAPRWRWPGRWGAPIRLLSYSEQSGIGRIVAARWTGREAEIAFTSHLGATLMSMACAGEGLAWLPMALAEEALADGRLVTAAGDEAAIKVEIRLFRGSGRLGPAAEAFWAGLSG